MPPKMLYFDVGNVLLAFSHERMCSQMAAVAGVTHQAIWDFLFSDSSATSHNRRYESGQIDTDQFFRCLCDTLRIRPDRRRLEEAVCDIFEPIAATAKLVRSLAAAGYRLGILSDTNPLQWAYFTDGRFPILASPGSARSPFSAIVVSYEVGTMKPDRAIYQAAVERACAPAADVFFVDDRDQNVDGARAAGIDAVKFRGVDQLIKDLRARGVAGI